MNILETDRLVIREVEITDASFIFELMNTPGWIEFIGDRSIHTHLDAQNYIINSFQKSYKEHGHGLYLIQLKTNKVPVGICGLINRKELADIDIGFALLPQHERNAYAFEAASAIMKNAKEVLKIDRIVAITSLNNTRSIKLLEKIGLHFKEVIDFHDEKVRLYSN